MGEAFGPIPWSSICSYCNFYQIDRESQFFVIDVIMSIDGYWLKNQSEKRQKEIEKMRQRGNLSN